MEQKKKVFSVVEDMLKPSFGEKVRQRMFEALTNQELIRMRVPLGDRPRLYDHLAALAGALAVGVPLERAADLLSSGR